ncbi:MAG TPA: glycosyltransferase family 4 protein [Candidatus Eisenbacteria bacterium]|nr:glycosyltransferase family 4 protein [Candidatus Eisenbacteria bacterium]
MGRALRVAHVVERMHLGGAERVVLEHARHASAAWPVGVVSINGTGWALEEAAAIGTPTLAFEAGTPRLAKVRSLARWLRAQRVDLVNGHNATGALYGTLAARLAGIACVRTEHSIHYAGKHSRAYPLLETWMTAVAARVVCVCRAGEASHARRFPWARRKFVTVLNGISEAGAVRARDVVRAELGLAEDAPVVLTVGSLSAQKAQHVLVEAFARVRAHAPRAALLLVGEGPARAALEAQAAGIGGAVRMLGARRDVADLLAAADVFALSSTREGLPIVVLEAMRAGRPVVASRIGGVPEAVEDGVTGSLAAPGDATGLAEAIARLALDPALARRMGAAGNARWRERFTAARMVRETETVYGEAAGVAPRA